MNLRNKVAGTIDIQDIFGNNLMVHFNHAFIEKEDFNMTVSDIKILNVPKHPSKVIAK